MEHLTPQILSLIEDGHLPLDIAEKVLNFDKDLFNPGEKPDIEKEKFSEELIAVAQALAYRKGTLHDINTIFDLLNMSYISDIEGPEAYRSGCLMSLEAIKDSIETESLNWLLVEVPEGRSTIEDGSVIGLCSYSTDGISRRNGEIEGTLGSVRTFAILPKFRGLCLGQRLLSKLENEIKKQGCVRIMFAVASTRVSLANWLEKRDFLKSGSISYPKGVGHNLIKESVKLDMYTRPIPKDDIITNDDIKTENNPNYTNNTNLNSKSRMTLPPHWRGIYDKDTTSIR